jgi:predicted RNA binding protein YcfA (HicA-like mRNA interferase family)
MWQPHRSSQESNGCVVPNHRELKLGILTGILKQAAVSADEFIAALRD